VSRVRSFDPNRVGALECRAWVTYYQRKWFALLVTSVRLVRAGFGMDWRRTLHAAWLVLRANQLWAKAPVSHHGVQATQAGPDGARRCMERFYRLVAEGSGEALDTTKAAALEVEWWRAHREAQHTPDGSRREVVTALVDLYSFLYGADPAAVRPAAELRAEAMVVSDQWVAEGHHDGSPLIDQERALLVRSFAALLAAVHR
jgi:hypothetical protein